ncbi:MAG TPA: MFS transporter [Candidatus Elarobacter sp.]|jgi:MFS family permease|nr:MFS transporter [Candidatus Elarobacter sp.]
MSERWRVLALMTTAQAGASVVQQALGSLSPILVATFVLTKAQLGVVFTALMLGSACFTAAAGIMTDRWGERRMVLFSGLVMTFALLAAAGVPRYPWLVACIALFGAAYAASTPAGGRAVLAWFDRDRGFAMGIRQTGVPVGGLIGALSLPFLAHAVGYRGAFVFAAIVVAVTTLIAYLPYRESRDDGAPPATLASVARGMRTLARDPRLIGVTLTCMTLVSVQLAMNAFVTVTAVTIVRTSPAVAALAFASAQGAAVCGRLGWGYLSDRVLHGERLVPFAIICVLAALAAAALALLGSGAVVALFAAAIVLGFSGAGWNGLMAAALAEVGGTERAASALGLALTAIFLASSVAPTAFGAVADHTSLRIAWLGMSALALVGMVPVLWLRTHLASPERRSARRAG